VDAWRIELDALARVEYQRPSLSDAWEAVLRGS
jgi:hypothetical protein